jgi:hypothetical protein
VLSITIVQCVVPTLPLPRGPVALSQRLRCGHFPGRPHSASPGAVVSRLEGANASLRSAGMIPQRVLPAVSRAPGCKRERAEPGITFACSKTLWKRPTPPTCFVAVASSLTPASDPLPVASGSLGGTPLAPFCRGMSRPVVKSQSDLLIRDRATWNGPLTYYHIPLLFLA